jgi:hypothetical protein
MSNRALRVIEGTQLHVNGLRNTDAVVDMNHIIYTPNIL